MSLFSKNKIDENKKILGTYVLEHISGLEISEGIPCKIRLYNNRLLIEPAGVEYNLNIDKIRDVDFKMDIDVKQYMKSNLAKGVVGGLAFGAVGAIIGATPKTKEKREVICYCIINYKNNSDVYIYLIFKDIYANSSEAAKLADKLKKLIKKSDNIKIDL